MAGETLTDQDKPIDQTWKQFSVVMLEDAFVHQRPVLFDLTNLFDPAKVLEDTGVHASTVTGYELRYLHTHWSRFQSLVLFYDGGEEVDAPWLTH